MSERKTTRKRAVRLTPDSLRSLKDALHARWQRDERAGRLTREARAELLGVSIATADRILSGKGVDRATLAHAFRVLELAWDDSCCEPVSPEPVPLAIETEITPSLPPSPGPSVVPVRRTGSNRFYLLGAAFVVALLGVGIGTLRPSPVETWRRALDEGLDQGQSIFHRADYRAARQRADWAVSVARRHDSASRLAEALRLSGDVAAAQGDLPGAREAFEEALRIRQALGQEMNLAALHEALGEVERLAGRFAESGAHLGAAHAGYLRHADPVGVAIVERDLGKLNLSLRRLGRARTYLRASMDRLRGLNKPDIETDVRAQQALILVMEGKAAEARPILADCLRYWSKREHPRWVAQLKLDLARAEVAVGNRTGAIALLTESKSAFDGVGDRLGSELAESSLAAASFVARRP